MGVYIVCCLREALSLVLLIEVSSNFGGRLGLSRKQIASALWKRFLLARVKVEQDLLQVDDTVLSNIITNEALEQNLLNFESQMYTLLKSHPAVYDRTQLRQKTTRDQPKSNLCESYMNSDYSPVMWPARNRLS